MLADIERSGMLRLPLWLLHHGDEPRHLDALSRALHVHERTLQAARRLYEPRGLLKTEGEPARGRGARLNLDLTPLGRRFAKRVDAIEATLGEVASRAGDEAAVGVLEAAQTWRYLHYLEEHDADAEARYQRQVVQTLRLPQNQATTLRQRLSTAGVIRTEGRSKGGRGLRLYIALTPAGRRVAALGHELAGFLKEEG